MADFDSEVKKGGSAGKGTGEKNPPAPPTFHGTSKKSEEPEEQLSPEAELLREIREERELLRRDMEEFRSERTKAPAGITDPASIRAIAEIVKSVVNADKDRNPLHMPDEPDDPDDFDEKGTMFYGFQFYLPIADDVRSGKVVFPPKAGTSVVMIGDKSFRLVEFTFDSGKRVRNGRQEDVINICKFHSKSKKLTEWLRKDSRYNKTFFEGLPANLTQGTVTYAKRMMQILAWARVQGASALISKCKELNIIPSTDIDEMRNNVSMKMAESEFTRDGNGAWIPKSMVDNFNNRFNEDEKADLLQSSQQRDKILEDKNREINYVPFDRVSGETANA